MTDLVLVAGSAFTAGMFAAFAAMLVVALIARLPLPERDTEEIQIVKVKKYDQTTQVRKASKL